MKKFFTLICALVATVAASAAAIADVPVCKHSAVIVFDDYTNNGNQARVKGTLFSGYLLDVTGGSIAKNKGGANLADPTTLTVYNDVDGFDMDKFVAKYGEYGDHLNSLRLKNNQDVLAMKVTAGSKLIFVGQGNNKAGVEARIPRIATSSDMADANTLNMSDNPKTSGNPGSTPAGYIYSWTADDDYTIYIGSFNGDMFLSYLIVEANEAPGTPSVSVSNQGYDETAKLYYYDVICKANTADVEGESWKTIVTYTTDGTAPTHESPVYTKPVRCYANQTVKFQAYMDFDDATPYEEGKLDGADNEAIVEFAFEAPTLTADGANVAIATEYNNAENVYTLNGGEETKGSSVTLDESATVLAYTVITNGSYATFKSKTVQKDVYVLTSVTENTTIEITAGEVVVDQEATDKDPDHKTQYMVKDGAISADKEHFFVKNLEFGVVNGDNEKYQINHDARYIKMNATNITFKLDEETSLITVTTSKNACKTLNPTDDPAVTTARQCYVNVDGTNYGTDDITNGDVSDLEDYANVITFELGAGIHTFQKYSGTGNILIYSILIEPGKTATDAVKAADEVVAPIVKKLTSNGIVIEKDNKAYNVAGAEVK
ncbi:MAG: chitobiase/beta-hexosaminidase C-terminal domain-containing protein [Prevotella sp.]|nr:chitobiase/beta-hexosaminidase C-terminal domain-containing protein [Candidatus Prevotella equi]